MAQWRRVHCYAQRHCITILKNILSVYILILCAMSYLLDDSISVEDAKASSDAAAARSAQEAVYIATVANEKRSVMDSVITYAIISFAMAHGAVMMRGTTFFTVLAAFMGAFMVTVNFKATMAAMLSVPGAGERRGRAFIELIARLLSLVLSYVQFLLVQLVTSRTNIFINDGHFSLESLVLPVTIFVFLYTHYHIQQMRCRVPPSSANST